MLHSGIPRELNTAIVGAGFRASTFLTSTKRLPSSGLAVFERGSRVGPGSFGQFDARTTSVGSKFFQHVNYQGVWGELLNYADYRAVALSDDPVSMTSLTLALDRLGGLLVRELSENLVCETPIDAINVIPGSGATLISSSGIEAHTQHVVLATGRHEVLHPALHPFAQKVELSGRFLSSTNDLSRRLRVGEFQAGPIVIVGSSHSAMSALKRIQRAQGSRDGEQVEVVVVYRSPARLLYSSLDDACRQLVPGREALPDPRTDVCPETGLVFRDSGLRHESRDLYCDLWARRIRGARLLQSESIEGSAQVFGDASLIVQAIGYVPTHPKILVNGIHAQPSTSLSIVDGSTMHIDGSRLDEISLLRIGQTPRHLRDYGQYGRDLYSNLRERLGLE